jgi:hypothetical protein
MSYKATADSLVPEGETFEYMSDFWRAVDEGTFWRREHFDEKWDTTGLELFYHGPDAEEDEAWFRALERVR